MKTHLPSTALALLTALAFASSARAASKKPAATPTPVPEPVVVHSTDHALPFNGKVSAIDKVGKTFTTENKQKQLRTYLITPETTFTKNTATATIDDIKIGEEIRGFALPKGNGVFETASIILGPHPELAALPAATPVPTPKPATPTPKPSKTTKPAKPAVKKPKSTPTPSASGAND